MRTVQLPHTDLVYAIGDIHGRLDLLEQAADLIFGHAGARAFAVVGLGDYVDRGPASRGVIDLLMQWQGRGSLVCLKGNHEAMMLEGPVARTGSSGLATAARRPWRPMAARSRASTSRGWRPCRSSPAMRIGSTSTPV